MSVGASPPAALGRRRSSGRRVLIAALLAAAGCLFFMVWLPTAREYYADIGTVQTGAIVSQYDLFQYWASGHNWRAGLDPYSALQGVAGALPVPRGGGVSGFIYPPTVLPLLGQLSRLPYDDARAAWLALCLATLLTSLAVGIAQARGRRWETAAVGALLFAASDPLLFHIRQGQIDMIVAGLAVTAYLLYGRWRDWPTALLFALAVSLKLTPAVLVLALVAYRRDWRLLLKVAVALAAVTAASLVVVDPRLYAEYFTKVLPAASEGNPFFHNQSLLRGWSHLAAWARYPSLAGFALVVAAAALAGRGTAAGPRLPVPDPDGPRLPVPDPAGPRLPVPDPDGGLHSRDLQVLALAVLGQLLFAPLSWRMAFVWAIVPMALVLAAAPWQGARWQYALAAAGAALMCLPLWDRPVLDSLNTLGALVAGAGLLAALFWPRTQAQGETLVAAAPPAARAPAPR